MKSGIIVLAACFVSLSVIITIRELSPSDGKVAQVAAANEQLVDWIDSKDLEKGEVVRVTTDANGIMVAQCKIIRKRDGGKDQIILKTAPVVGEKLEMGDTCQVFFIHHQDQGNSKTTSQVIKKVTP